MNKKRVLVIGGTGFIGSHLCKRMIEVGHAATSVSLRPARLTIPGVQYVVANLADVQSVRTGLSGKSFDYVINSGGYINHRFFCDGGRELIQSHFDGVQNLLVSLDRDSIVRFVQLGSSDEYGAAPSPQKESLREAPISPYSLAKVATTHFLQMLWRTEKFPAVILRLFLTYGPGQNKERFIPQLILGCLENRNFPVSEGKQVRDFCYIEDVIDAIMASLRSSEACGEVINLSSGSPITIRAVAERVQSIVGRGIPEYGKVPYRPGENMRLFADIQKASRLLNWQPATSIDRGLRKTIDFFEREMANQRLRTSS